jgi:hypothetical protein
MFKSTLEYISRPKNLFFIGLGVSSLTNGLPHNAQWGLSQTGRKFKEGVPHSKSDRINQATLKTKLYCLNFYRVIYIFCADGEGDCSIFMGNSGFVDDKW